MGNNDGRKEFEIIISSLLNQSKSKKQINEDIKSLEKVVNSLRLTATFAKGATKKELNSYIRQLGDQLSTIKLKAKFDERALKREINQALNNVSYKEIDLLNINENKFKLKAKKALADTKTFVSKNPIYVNVELKKEKLNNQLTTYLTKNSKIRESEVLLKEADMLRDKISAINDKNSLKNATESFQLFKSEVQSMGFQTTSTTDKVKNMVSGITKVGSAFGIASIAVNNFVKSLQTLKGNDTILTEISKTSEMTKQQLVELGNEAFKTASQYGQLSPNYLIAVQEMARSGYEDTSKELGKLSLLAQSAGDMTAENANNFLLATDAAYEYSGSIEKLNAVLDGANYISNKNSASLTDLADAIRVSASYASNAGVSIDQLTAAEGTMIAVTKRSGLEMGRSFRSILLNLQQVSGEFDGEVIDEEQLKKVESRCHSLGVELEYMKDGIATLRNPIEILKELADVYNSLPDNSADKQGLISDLGGKYHANALSALLSRWDLYEKMLVDYSKGTGSALEEANKTADSWEGRLNSLRNSWDSFVNSLTNKNAIKGGISFFDKSIQSAETLVDTLGEIPVLLTTINTAMVALNKDYGITQVINPETNKFDIQGNMFGIDFSAVKAQKKHFEEASKAISVWNKELNVGKIDIEGFNIEVVKNNKQLKSYLSTCSKDAPASLSGYKAYLNAAGVSTDALRIKTVLLNSALTLGASIAIQFAVTAISKLANAEKEALQSAQEAAKTYTDSSDTIKSYVERYKELHDALIAAKSNEEETFSVKKQLLELQNELNTKFGQEYGKLSLLTDAYADHTEAIKAYNQEAAKTYLNKEKKGIDKATSEMAEQRRYRLGDTAKLSNQDAQEVRKQILDLTKEFDKIDLTESGIIFTGTALEADKVINEFMTKVRELQENYKDSGQVIQNVFDGVLDSSAQALGKAGNVLETYQEVYEKAQMAQIASNDSLSKGYNEVVSAVETYNEAVLKSENPYDDKNVKSAWDNLQKVKQGIQVNKEEWGQYSNVMNKVFDSVNDDVYSFYQTMKNDDISKFTEELKGLSNTDLQAMFDDGNNGDAFDKLCEKAKAYGLEVQDVIDLLIQLGIAQGEIDSGVDSLDGGNFIKSFSEAWNAEDFSKAKDELLALAEAGKLTPETLQSTEEYKKLLEQTGMSAEEAAKKINSMTDASTQLQSMSSQISKMSDMLADKKNKVTASADDLASFDVEVRGLDSWDRFERVMGSSTSTMEQCQQAANALATEWVNSNNFLSNLNDTNKDYYITQLDNMGIENAEAIVTDALTQKERELTAQTEFETLATQHNSDAKNVNNQVTTDLTNATVDEIAQIIAEGNATADTTAIMADFAMSKLDVNNINLDTSSDIEQIVAIANAAGASTTYVNALETALKSLQSASQKKFNYNTKKSGTLGLQDKATNFFSGVNTNQSLQEIFDKAEENNLNKEYDNAIKTANDIISNFKPLDANKYKVNSGGSNNYKPTSGTGNKKGGSTGTGTDKNKKEETKQTVDWVDRLLSVLRDNIDLTKTKFDGLFNTKTPKGLSDNIKKVTKNLKSASSETSKWKKKLDKINISDSLKKNIQKGKKLDLSKYSKSEQQAIKNYQKYWGKYSSAKKNENNLNSQLDNLKSQKGKYNNLDTQIKQMKELEKADTKAIAVYQKKANGVKLSESLKKKVRSGDYSIKDYSSETQTLIQEYQGYIDKIKELEKEKITLKDDIKQAKKDQIQLLIDDAQIRKDTLDTKIDNTSDTKKKIAYLKDERKEIEKIYNLKIKNTKKSLEIKQLEIEKDKELRENTIAQYQAKVDQAQSYLDLYSSKIDMAITATSKNKLEKEKIKYIKQSYDYQIKIAKEENDTLKVSQLKVDKEKELLAVKKEILQNTLDQNDKEMAMLEAKYQNATTVKDKNKNIDQQNKLIDKNVSAYRTNYNDAKKTLSSTSKSVNKTTSSAKSLSDSDRKKIDSYVQSGKAIPESLLKKVKAVDSNWYDTLVNYNNKYADRSSTIKSIRNSKVSKTTQVNLEKAINAGKTISKKTLNNVKKKDPTLYNKLTEWNKEQDNRQNIIKKISSTKTLTSGDKKKIKSLVDGKKPISDSLLKKVASANPSLYTKLVKYNADLEYFNNADYDLDVSEEQSKTEKRGNLKEQFDNIDDSYSKKIGFTDKKVKAYQDQISLLEAKGMKVGSALYAKQMELNQINMNRLISERTEQIKKLSEFEKGTPEWYAAQDAIYETESALKQYEIEQANLQKSINQLKFDQFDALLAKINDIVDETDFLIDMLDSEKFFDDSGKITDDGITALGLTMQNRDVYLAEADKYKEWQSELDEMYKNGKLSLDEYNEKTRECSQGQREMLKSANDCNKEMQNLVKQGLDAQNQALEKSVSKQKELLQSEKDLYDFQKKLNDSNKTIARLEKQIAVLEGDTSEENRKKLRELKSQLEDAKQDQKDFLYDKAVSDQESALDQLLENSQKSTEDYLKDTDKVLSDACELVNKNTETVSKNIEQISKDTGYNISEYITKSWEKSDDAVDKLDTSISDLSGTIATKTPAIVKQIKLISDEMAKLAEEAEKASESIVKATSGKDGGYGEHGDVGKASLADIKTFISSNKQKAKHDKSYYAPLNQYIYDKTGGVLSKENEKKLAEMLNVDIKTDLTGEAGKKELEKIRDALKLAGFSKGGVISELSNAIRLNGDTVLVSAKPGERMLTEQQNGYWEKWTQSLPNLMELTDIIKPNVNIPTAIPTVNREQSPVYNIDSSITVDGVATNEIVKDMANVAKKQAENVVAEINRHTYAKGVRWK